jgi:hypothetical protein
MVDTAYLYRTHSKEIFVIMVAVFSALALLKKITDIGTFRFASSRSFVYKEWNLSMYSNTIYFHRE